MFYGRLFNFVEINNLPLEIALISLYHSYKTKSILHDWLEVSHESNLHSVPYNRPLFGVRSCVKKKKKKKNVKSLSENQYNSWIVLDNLMKPHRLAQLIKMCVVGKNEHSCSLRFLVICPLI